ncbi:MAG: TonB-dependent receptor [Sphingomonadales bacterium BRH_c42]|nr:MAG: TonB-dependent receptor [Sphingomonadales bacterium BRH_c42]
MNALPTLRASLLISCVAAIVPTAAIASDAAEDRDYLGREIVVTGEREGYGIDDGSSGTKTPTPLIDVPQTISVLTEDQLDDQSVTSLNDALRYVPGVSLETGEGNRDEVFIRGQETTADFYIDGLRDDLQYFRPLYNVERVEVLKGANALIFGRGAGGGAINRVAKRAQLAEQFVAADASVDTWGGFALGADINQPLGDSAALRVNSTYEEFANHRDFFTGRFIGFSPTLTANLGEQTKLILSYTYDDDRRLADRGIPSLDGAPLEGFDRALFGDRDFNRSDVEVHIARARLEHEFTADLSTNFSLQYANYDKLYANILPEVILTDAISGDRTVRLSGYRDTTRRDNWIAQGNLVWQPSTGSVDHMILLGFEGAWQDSANARANVQFDNGSGGFTSKVAVPLAREIVIPAFSLTGLVRDRETDLSTYSFYLQDQIALADWIDVIGGVRYDEFRLDSFDAVAALDVSRNDNRWNPRFGINLKPREDVTFYASYSESFLPASGDQFLVLSPSAAALRPETFENKELGVKWAIHPGLLLTGAIFRLERSNTPAPDPNDPQLTVLSGKSRVDGAEIALAGQIMPDLNVSLGYTWLDGEIRSSTSSAPAGRTLEQVPSSQITAWGRYDFSDRFGIGAGLIHQSKQFASLSNNVALPGYVRVDAALYYTLNEKVSLQVNIENLFDEDYFASAHGDNNIQPGEPISARFGVRVKL